MHHQNLTVTDGGEGAAQQRIVRMSIRRQLVAEEAVLGPAHVGEAAGLGEGQRVRRRPPARRAPDRVEPAARHRAQPLLRRAELGAHPGAVEHGALARAPGDIAHAFSRIAAEVPVPHRVAAEGVALGHPGAPERGPGVGERGVAAIRALIGDEEGCLHPVPCHHRRDLLRPVHPARVDRQKHRAAAAGRGGGRGERGNPAGKDAPTRQHGTGCRAGFCPRRYWPPPPRSRCPSRPRGWPPAG